MECCPKNRTCLLTVMLALFLHIANAQPYYFNHYQVENGLSNNSVECSLQDSDGFLWFGTLNGLNRFDGYTFKIFRHNPEDSTSIGSNFIRCLYYDRNNILWVGTNRGTYTYNKLQEKFSLLRSVPAGNNTQISGDAGGNYWFIINSVVYRYNANTRKSRSYLFNEQKPVATSVALGADGKVWASTSTGSLKQYIPALDSFVTYSAYEKNNSPTSIEKIYPVDNRFFLIGTSNQGVKYFDVEKKIYKDIITYNDKHTGIYVRGFIRRSDHEYWIGTETGIYIYNTASGSIMHLQKEYDNPYSLSDDVIFTFCQDREGGLWIGTYLGGINYLPRPFTSFRKFFPRLQSPSLSGNAVHEICKDGFGNFWIGTEDGGVNKIDIQKGKFQYFRPDGLKGSVAYHNIHGLLPVGNELWIGTFEHGLDVMNISSG